MSIVASEPSPAPLQSVPASPLPAVRPQIAAMRRMLVKRFPSLAFAVRTNGLPLYEVLLATDRSLFDPANASKRTPATFYSSRQDGGLRPTRGPDEVYLVPSAVLRGFAAATPRPSAIYYTAVAYATPDGGSPAFAQPPESLALTAPSVGVSPDFTGDTIAKGLSLRDRPLRVVSLADDTQAPAAPAAAAAPAPAVPAPAPAAPVDPVADAGAGEDGYSVLQAHPDQAAPPAPPAAAPSPAPASATAPPVAATAPIPAPTPAPASTPAPAPYDDGYGDMDDGRNGWHPILDGSHALDASFPPGYAEPAQLTGDDDATDALATWAPANAAALSGLDDRYPYRSLDDSVAAPPRPALPLPLQLTIDDKKVVVLKVAQAESGAAGYAAINPDGEFAGLFNRGTYTHPAYQTYHVGLSYGLIQFTQDGGSLGQLLTMMRDRDGTTFAATFGPDSDELVRVTNLPGPGSSQCPGGRSARVQPIGGADIWEQPWRDRFVAAGQVEAFQAAQLELAATAYLDPMLAFCGNLGFDTDRAMAMAYDRSVQMGPVAARVWIANAAGPIATDALRQQALAALGFADLRSFQQAYGQTADGQWGPMSHAALTGVLRALGAASPIPVPALDQMLDSLVRSAATEFWADRPQKLRTATDFTDRQYPRA